MENINNELPVITNDKIINEVNVLSLSKEQSWKRHFDAIQKIPYSKNEYFRRNNISSGSYYYWNHYFKKNVKYKRIKKEKTNSSQNNFIKLNPIQKKENKIIISINKISLEINELPNVAWLSQLIKSL